MDHRLYGILNSLLINIDVLDQQLLSLQRSEQFRADGDNARLIARIRETCTSALHSVESMERTQRGNAFVIPPNVMASLE